MTSAVSVRRAGRRFGERDVLRDVDLEVAPGEILVIVGQSGCGKSTLLRAIGGLDEGHTGDIRWNFEKFLIGRDGKVLARFSPQTEPEAEEIVAAVEGALA